MVMKNNIESSVIIRHLQIKTINTPTFGHGHLWREGHQNTVLQAVH